MGWRRAPVLSVDSDPQERGPHTVLVGVVPGRNEQSLNLRFQLVEVLSVEVDPNPSEPELAFLAGLLGRRSGVDVGSGSLQRCVEEQRCLRRRRVVVGWLHGSWGVDALDLAAGEPPVLGYFDQLALFELSEVVVEPVGRRADARRQLLGRARLEDEQFVEADTQWVRECPVDGPQTGLMDIHFLTRIFFAGWSIVQYMTQEDQYMTQQDVGTQSRSGVVLRRLRWPVLVIWVLAILALDPLASSLSKVTDDGAAAYLPPSAQSTHVAELQQAAQHGPGQPESDPAIVVFARSGRLTAGDLAAVAAARRAVDQLATRTSGLGRAGPVQRSGDGQAAAFTVTVTAPQHSLTSTDTDAVKAVRRAVQAAASRAGDGLQVAVTGQAAVTADSGSGSQSGLLFTALVIVALILLLVYRSPVLWLLPLFGALGAVVVAEAGAHGLVKAGLTVSSLSSAVLVVLVFGAASDYALLLTHRYRQELGHHATTEDAMAVALRRTLPTLVASAATVTGAMLCLLTAESASLHGLGPVGAVAIVSALLAQATFLPALLLVVGRRAFWPRVPRPGGTDGEPSRLWSNIGARVARDPVRVALCVVVVLGAGSVGFVALRTDNNPLSDLKGHPGSVVGAQLLAEHFPAGAIAPLVVLSPPGQATSAAAAARATSGVATVLPGEPVDGYVEDSVTLSVPPYGPEGSAVIEHLRQRLGRAAPAALVGGGPAVYYDIAQAANRDTAVIIPLVLVVTCVVIALLLQAVVAPLLLVATTALSFAASFGLSNLLWRYGLGYARTRSLDEVWGTGGRRRPKPSFH